MVENSFNPFILGGEYSAQVIDPDVYTITSRTFSLPPKSKEDKMYSFFQAGVPAIQQKLVNFLIVNNTTNLGDPPSAFNTGLPLSFYARKSYWITPPNNQKTPNSKNAITERCLAHYGADIYDVATAQCALSIFPELAEGMSVASGQTKRLLSSFSMPNVTYPTVTLSRPTASTIRGWTDVKKKGDNTSAGAYFFRMIADQYKLTDPLLGGAHKWSDWKPITGENAWAAFIGPLQTAYSENKGIPPLESDAVQLGLKVLPAYQAMVSPGGGIYYAPWNTSANKAGTFVDPFMISNENNFSSYAGLTMLEQVLAPGGEQENLAIVTHLLEGSEN